VFNDCGESYLAVLLRLKRDAIPYVGYLPHDCRWPWAEIAKVSRRRKRSLTTPRPLVTAKTPWLMHSKPATDPASSTLFTLAEHSGTSYAR